MKSENYSGKKTISRIISLMVALLLIATTFPLYGAKIKAAESVTQKKDISSGSVTVSGPDDYLIIQSNQAETTNNITISSGYKGTVTINNLKLKTGGSPCININANTEVTLKLIGDNTAMFRSGGVVKNAVVRVASSAKLTLESYNGVDADGKLTIVQSDAVSGAALGSSMYEDNGTIIVNSGTIHTTGGDDSAGIGGGAGGAVGGSGGGGGTIIINGGMVSAICDSRSGTDNSAAAIGAGFPCYNKNTRVTINGGEITAVTMIPSATDPPWFTERSLSGAAIGAGNVIKDQRGSTNPTCGNFDYILITGGKIKASVLGTFTGPGGSHEKLVNGRDGVALGGGANPYCKGTIIVLPSADVTELYGAEYRGEPPETAEQCSDIGNANQIFYLNSADARVQVENSPIMQMKKFTACTTERTLNADIYARVYAADSYLPAFASLVGRTDGTTGVYRYDRSGGELNYYTNLEVDYYTKAKAADGTLFATYKLPALPSTTYVAADLNGDKSNDYVPPTDTTNVYNLIIPKDNAPAMSIKAGGPFVPTTSLTPPSIPTPPGAGGQWTHIDPSPSVDDGEINIHFGEWNFGRTGAIPISTTNYPSNYSILKFKIQNEGSQPMKIEADMSRVNSFILEGPVVSDPPVAGGAVLPPNSTGTITVKTKQIIRAGDNVEPLVFHITNDDSVTTYDKTITVNLRIKVNQLKVYAGGSGETANQATVRAITPVPPVSTNAAVANLTAQAKDSVNDGVKTIWYKVENTSALIGQSAGDTPDTLGETGWTKITGDQIDGIYLYSKNFNVDLPQTNGSYYIHWFVETENTIASEGAVGPYEVLRDNPVPTLTGPPLISTSAPYTFTVTFDRSIISLSPNMFRVTNGTPGTVTPIGADNKTFEVTVTANGNGPFAVYLPAGRVQDNFGNLNVESNTLTPDIDNASPSVNFSTIKDKYHAPTSGVNFKIVSGISGDNSLFLTDGSTPLTSANIFSSGAITIKKDNAVFTPSSTSFANNILTINDSLAEGKYEIIVAAGLIKNSTGLGIAQRNHIFEIRIPVVSGITATPTTMDYNAGTVTLNITGTNLEYATKENDLELNVNVSDGTSNTKVTATINNSTSATATYNIPMNKTMYPITYTYTPYLGDTVTTYTANTVVTEAPALASDLLVTENSNHSGAVPALELTNAGGEVYFVIDGINLHTMNIGLDNSDTANIQTLTNSDFNLNSTADKATSIVSVHIPENKTKADIVYKFTVTNSGAATGATATVTVKKPQRNVTSLDITPTKHSAAGGTSVFNITGSHMDVGKLQVYIKELNEYVDVSSFSNGGANATVSYNFLAHPALDNPLRNDVYNLEVFFDDSPTGITGEVVVGDSKPSITGSHASPNYFASVNDTMQGNGKSVITIEGNYLENYNSLEIKDLIFGETYTVQKSGCDTEAKYTVTVPSAIGLFDYEIIADGSYSGFTVQIGVGEKPTDTPATEPGDENESRDIGGDNAKRRGEWAGGTSHGGGGSKGGGFTGRQEVDFEIVKHQSTIASKTDPKNPVMSVANVDLFTKQHFDLAASGAKAGTKLATKSGDGILTIRFDTTADGNDKSIEGRVYIKLDSPVPDIYPGVYTRDKYTVETRNLFLSKFDNKNIKVVHLDQNNTFFTTVEIAAKVDFGTMNTDSLYFYRLDRKTGEYQMIDMPKYYTDTSGFLHFFIKDGGDIIITDSPLTISGKKAETGSFSMDELPKTLTPALYNASLTAPAEKLQSK